MEFIQKICQQKEKTMNNISKCCGYKPSVTGVYMDYYIKRPEKPAVHVFCVSPERDINSGTSRKRYGQAIINGNHSKWRYVGKSEIQHVKRRANWRGAVSSIDRFYSISRSKIVTLTKERACYDYITNPTQVRIKKPAVKQCVLVDIPVIVCGVEKVIQKKIYV